MPSGGRFDGAAGVVAALEVARSLQDRGLALDHDLEVIDCLAEEANVYGVSCVGSRGLSGRLTPELLAYREPGGESVAEALARMGGDAARIGEAQRSDVAAFLELHIEQGRVLESGGLDVGIVRSIVGILRLELIIEGRADHAGTTPMPLRIDALVRRRGGDPGGARSSRGDRGERTPAISPRPLASSNRSPTPPTWCRRRRGW